MLAYLNSLKVKTAKSKSSFSPQINNLKTAIKKIDAEMNGYLTQVPNATKALIDLINGQVERLNADKMKLLDELSRLTIQEKTPEFNGYDIDKVIAEWANMDMDERKSVAKVFIKEITVSDEEINVVFY